MKNYRLRLAITCVLEFDATTETAQEAFLAAKTYESLIRSEDWQKNREIAPIRNVEENLYLSKIEIADEPGIGLLK